MNKVIAFLLSISLAFSFTACQAPAASGSASSVSSTSASQQAHQTTDPSGAKITVPETIDSIAVLAPSITETLVALGHGDQIVACDSSSASLSGLPADLLTLDLMQPDMEQLAALTPDVLFVSNMTLYDQESPYQQLIDLGVCVICVPTSDSIADIQSDLAFIASVFGEEEKGQAMIDEMQAELDRIGEIGKSITDKKKVYFEISAAPNLYSFGSGAFLNEMLERIGAENILAEEQGWLPVDSETVVAANPDVILTNVNYVEDPVSEILGRSGWENITAVSTGQVYYIDNLASSLPNQNIVKALDQMAQAIYPEYYAEQ